MPRSQAELVNRYTGNQILPFPTEIAKLELFHYWHTNANDDPAGMWFRDQVQIALTNLE
jgi:hypothetical protein